MLCLIVMGLHVGIIFIYIMFNSFDVTKNLWCGIKCYDEFMI